MDVFPDWNYHIYFKWIDLLMNQFSFTIYEARAGAYDYVTVGKFRLKKDVIVVDLKKINQISPFLEGLDCLEYAINIKDILKIKTRDKSNPEFRHIPLKNYFEKKTSGNYTRSSIHGVKGETYDAVLIYIKSKTGKTLTPKFLMEGDLEDELMRIAYVAMTRPRRLLMIAMPENKKYEYI